MNLKTHRLLIGKRGSYRQGGSHPNERTNERTKESRKEGGRLACRKAGTKEPRKEGMNHVSASSRSVFPPPARWRALDFMRTASRNFPKPPSPPRRRPLRASDLSGQPGLNRKREISVSTTGSRSQWALRASTASSSQWALAGLNGERPIWNIMPQRMPNRMSECVSDKMRNGMPEGMSEWWILYELWRDKLWKVGLIKKRIHVTTHAAW